MFGKSRPVVFEPYGRRRSRPAMPRWLVLLLVGIALGAGSVLFVQERYLPPRLSAAASERLQTAAQEAQAQHARLDSELREVRQQLEAALRDKSELAGQLDDSRKTVTGLREDVTSLVAALPPDPRGGMVQIRAARFEADAARLSYDVVLTRDAAGDKPLTGVMQLIVAGEPGRGSDATVALEPVPLSLGRWESLRGSLPLPDGFKPRQATVRVLDRPDGKLLGMRVLYVR